MADPKSFFLSPEAQAYLVDHSDAPDAVQEELIAETAALGGISMMQISPEQGAFMTVFTRLLGARRRRRDRDVHRVLGALHRPRPARRRLAPLLRRERGVDLGRTPGVGTSRSGRQDHARDRAGARHAAGAAAGSRRSTSAFIDADKPAYPGYYEEILARLRPNGVILVDNVLWGGAVLEPAGDDRRTPVRSRRSTTWSRPTTGSRA